MEVRKYPYGGKKTSRPYGGKDISQPYGCKNINRNKPLALDAECLWRAIDDVAV